jgi:hypothetical protein
MGSGILLGLFLLFKTVRAMPASVFAAISFEDVVKFGKNDHAAFPVKVQSFLHLIEFEWKFVILCPNGHFVQFEQAAVAKTAVTGLFQISPGGIMQWYAKAGTVLYVVGTAVDDGVAPCAVFDHIVMYCPASRINFL